MEKQYETMLVKNESGVEKMICENWKTILMFLLVAIVSVSPIFGQESSSIAALDGWGDRLVSLFVGPWVKGLCVVAVIIRGLIAVGQFNNGGGVEALKPLMF